MTETQLLNGMIKLLEKPESWTQYAPARKKTGESCAPFDSEAYCWCITGAACSVLPEGGVLLFSDIWNRFYEGSPEFYNDFHGRWHSHVLSRLKTIRDLIVSSSVRYASALDYHLAIGGSEPDE